MNTDYIVVYGLLKSMYDNDAAKMVRSHCEAIGEGTLPGYLYDLGNYPGVIFDEESSSTVYGEVFKIIKDKEKLIQFLDDFEGVGSQFKSPNEYRKEVIPVQTEMGEIQAWCYIYNLDPKGFKLIESGRYENKGKQP